MAAEWVYVFILRRILPKSHLGHPHAIPMLKPPLTKCTKIMWAADLLVCPGVCIVYGFKRDDAE